jgi:hypothetical protein
MRRHKQVMCCASAVCPGQLLLFLLVAAAASPCCYAELTELLASLLVLNKELT